MEFKIKKKSKNRIAYSTSVGCGFDLGEAAERITVAGGKLVDILTIEGWVHVNPSDMADDWEATVARVDALMNRLGLTPIALNSMLGPKMHERTDEANARRQVELEALLRFMRHYGIGVAAIQPPLNVDPALDPDEVFHNCVATLREQVEAGEKAGVQFALDLHTRSPFETMEQAKRLLAEMPEAPVVYDATHFVSQGIDIKDSAWLMENAKHSHLRDAATGKLQAPYGEGEVDFDWVCGTLKDKGYEGDFSIEYLGGKDAGFDVMDSAKRLHGFLSERFS